MHVTRVYRPTVREALAEARAQLGPGALVLSTEMVPVRGWRGWVGQRHVRLTAACERAPESVTTSGEATVDRPPVTADRHPEPFTPARAGVVARLKAVGLDPVLANAVAARLSDAECRYANASALRRAIADTLAAAAAPEDDFSRCEVFIGPPGVGKTTTIAKIAARERAANGRTLALVAADAFRAGAIEQLRSYAAIVQSPFRVARTADELQEALAAARHPALVDTAGRSPADDDGLASLAPVLRRRPHVRTHLVMAADTAAATAARIFERYAVLEPVRVVITKLDEADSVAPLLRAIRDRGLAVSYLGTGQRVPDDLARATPARLAAMLLGEPALEAVTCH